jgi:hypothetical protein
MDEPLTNDLFVPYIGRRFSFAGQPVALRLGAVNANPTLAMPGATRAPFILVLHGPAGDILPEGHYQATIEDGPTVAFHIMPIHTPVPGRQDYQVVFN